MNDRFNRKGAQPVWKSHEKTSAEKEAWLRPFEPGFPRIHTSLTLTIRPETLGNIEFNCIFTCHLLHSVV